MIVDTFVDAVAVSLAPTLAVAVGAAINWWLSSQATKAAALTQRMTEKAAIDALEAQRAASTAAMQASEAAQRLIQTAQKTTVKLDHIASTSDATHKIVNGQRTAMLNTLAAMASRIARENPNDQDAQIAAEQARKNAQDAS